MTQSGKQTFSFNVFYTIISVFLTLVTFFSCNAKSSEDTAKAVDTNTKVAPESFHFTPHIVESHTDGSKAEIDTVSGYQKYYYANGKLQMEGKVTKAAPKDYRDGIWNYYNEQEQLMKQETYTKEGKINELEFMYFINGKPLSKTYQYYEGDYNDKKTFKFHKIETLFDTAGKKLSERHWINGNLFREE
jgi:antitoxin component YwqK of YwqJK toxin-antitoxin module